MTDLRPTGYVFDDGGRSATRKGKTKDCSVRAMAIATGQDYETSYAACKAAGFTPAKGMLRKNFDRVMADLGWVWQPFNPVAGQPRVKLHDLSTTCIARVSKHFVAVIDGVVHDNHDSRRLPAGRAVYGIYVHHDHETDSWKKK